MEDSEIEKADLLIIGTPTVIRRPSVGIHNFFSGEHNLKDKYVAVFETRFATTDKGIGLRLLKRALGSTAEKIAHSLNEQGIKVLTPPTGFIVSDGESSLKDAELERAASWAKNISSQIKATS